MKRVAKRMLCILVCIVLSCTLSSITALAAAPAFNPYYTPPKGAATPASPAGTTAAVAYEFTARPLSASGGSCLFDGTATQYRAEFIAPVVGTDYGTVTFENNAVQYTPNAAAAEQTVQFKVYAANAKNEWTTNGITFTVAVGAQPTDASSNANLTSLQYQIADGDLVDVPGFATNTTDYKIALPVGTALGQQITLTAITEDANASVSTTQTTTAWEASASRATATVTAENGATQKVYTIWFYVLPMASDPIVTFNGRECKDGDTVVLGTQETAYLDISLGTGTLGARSASWQSYGTAAGHSISSMFDGLYPYVYGNQILLPAQGDTFTLTINFYSGNIMTDKTQTPMQTITLTIVRHDHTWGNVYSADSLTHWVSCTDPNCPAPDARGEEKLHTGGTATCTEKAVCSVCQSEYGTVDAYNHTKLVKTEATPATHMKEGNIAYWYCEACGKYYSDEAGTKEITLADTVLPKLPEHTPDGTGWKTDENGHWQTCACGAKINEAAHAFVWVTDKAATATEAGARHEACTVCGYAKAAVEIPATGASDTTGSTTTTTPSTDATVTTDSTATTTTDSDTTQDAETEKGNAPAAVEVDDEDDEDTATNKSLTSPNTGAQGESAAWFGTLLAALLLLTGTLTAKRKKATKS